jgi:GT2 family glycosyltransferase
MRLPKSLKEKIRPIKKEIVKRRILANIDKDKVFNVYHHKPIIPAADPVKKLTFKNAKSPLVSIIIPTYNQWYNTYSCLLSILANTKNIDYEIIIADDASTDETQNIRTYVENIEIIRNDKNLGFLKNCNHAAKFAKGKYILFLNNDTNVQKEWLKYLLEIIEKDETIGIVGPKFTLTDGRIQEAGGIIWKDGSSSHFGYADAPEKPEYNYVKEVDYISGACLMVRKKLWDIIDGFDERFVPIYYEDVDLAFEGRNFGYKVVYQPKSVVLHFEGMSYGRNVNTESKYRLEIGRRKFLEKWQKVLEKEHFEKGNDIFVARDRSSSKKTILIFDDEPFVDAMTKKLSEMGLNIKILREDFYRYEPYTSNLEQSGIEVLYGYWYYKNIKRWLEDNSKYFDYVYSTKPFLSKKYLDLINKKSEVEIIDTFENLI